jgi:hypothetical protein
MNGTSPNIALPPTASAEQVLARLFDRVSFDEGRVSWHTILEARSVVIGGEEFFGLLVLTNLGRKIVLLRYEGTILGWWSRVEAEG